MPLCGTTSTGRRVSDLVDIYTHLRTLKLGDFNSDVLSSKVVGLTLSEYCIARQAYCQIHHTLSGHSDCESFLKYDIEKWNRGSFRGV